SPVEIFRLGSLVQRQGRVGISRRQLRPRFLRALGRSLLPEFLGQLYELRGLRPNRLPGRRACFELLADDAGQGLRSLGELTHDLLDARIGPTPRGPSPRKAPRRTTRLEAAGRALADLPRVRVFPAAGKDSQHD